MEAGPVRQQVALTPGDDWQHLRLPLDAVPAEGAELTLEVETVQGTRHVLRMSRAARGGTYLLHVEGSPHVFSAKPEATAWLHAPLGMLVDREWARTPRDRIEAVRLVAEGRETRLESRGFSWYLGTGALGETIAAPRLADSDRVADVLGAIEEVPRDEPIGLRLPENGPIFEGRRYSTSLSR